MENTMERLKEAIKERIGEYEERSVRKNNGITYTGITIKSGSVSPVVYLDKVVEMIEAGCCSIEEAVQRVEYLLKMESPKFDLAQIMNPKILTGKLVNKEQNEEYLQDAVYEEISDLALVYLLDAGTINSGFGTIKVTPDMFKRLGVSKEEASAIVHNKIVENSYLINVSPISTLILSNKSGINGAVSIACKEILDQVLKRLNTKKMVILPSSIHEVICHPFLENDDIHEYEVMVREGNDTQVAADEILSYNVYVYDGKELSIA